MLYAKAIETRNLISSTRWSGFRSSDHPSIVAHLPSMQNPVRVLIRIKLSVSTNDPHIGRQAFSLSLFNLSRSSDIEQVEILSLAAKCVLWALRWGKLTIRRFLLIDFRLWFSLRYVVANKQPRIAAEDACLWKNPCQMPISLVTTVRTQWKNTWNGRLGTNNHILHNPKAQKASSYLEFIGAHFSSRGSRGRHYHH